MIQFFRNQTAKLATAFVRFPLPLLSGICFAISGWYFVHLKSGAWQDSVLKIVLTCALGMVLFTGLMMYEERYMSSSKWKNFLPLMGLPILFAYYFLTPDLIELPDSKNIPLRFILLLASFFILFIIAPFIRTNQPLGFWQYIKIVISRLIITIMAAIILFAGLSLALLSIDHLFDINIKEDLYFQVWFLVVGVFSLIFFLSDLPENFDVLEQDEHYPKLIKIFAQYVLLPLLAVYLVILYLYIGKILITQNWPNGWVAMPIFIFAAVGIVNHVFLYPLLRTNQERWPKIIINIFYGLLLPTIFMLFAALWKRIEQYGLTELRYLGLIIGGWLLINAIYQLLNKNKQFKISLISLVVIILLVSAGPISLFSVAKNNQIHRLRKILEQHQILQNNKITPLNIKNLSSKDKSEIYVRVSKIVDYLMDNHGPATIQAWFNEPLNTKDGKKIKSSYQMTENAMLAMGLKYIDEYGQPSATSYLNIGESNPRKIYQVDNMDYVIRLDGLYLRMDKDKRTAINGNDELMPEITIGGNNTVYLNPNGDKIIIGRSEQTRQMAIILNQLPPVYFDLEKAVKQAKKSQDQNKREDYLNYLNLTSETSQLKAHLIVEQISGQMIDDELDEISLQGILFLKRK